MLHKSVLLVFSLTLTDDTFPHNKSENNLLELNFIDLFFIKYISIHATKSTIVVCVLSCISV